MVLDPRITETDAARAAHPGVDHVSYTYRSLEDLVATYERLQRPRHRAVLDHQPRPDHVAVLPRPRRQPGRAADRQLRERRSAARVLPLRARSTRTRSERTSRSTTSSRASREQLMRIARVRGQRRDRGSAASTVTTSSRSTRLMSSKPTAAGTKETGAAVRARGRAVARAGAEAAEVPRDRLQLRGPHRGERQRDADVPGVLQQADIVRHRTVRPDRRARGVEHSSTTKASSAS